MIYLAHLSHRVPLIPPFHWNADGREPDAAVSEFFDLSQVSTYFDTPLVEMHEIRLTTSSAERHKLVEFDGEVEQFNHVGGVYRPGDKIYAQTIEDDSVGCWSIHESGGNSAHESGYDLYRIREWILPMVALICLSAPIDVVSQLYRPVPLTHYHDASQLPYRKEKS